MKKDGTRFTIRFNPVDPRQFRAMNALEAAGQRKSTLIADAVYEYLERRGENGETFSLPPVLAPLVAAIPQNEIPEETLRPPISESMTDIESDFASDSADTETFDNEIHDAILEGLAAFDL